MDALRCAWRRAWPLAALAASACTVGVPPVTILDGSRCTARPDLVGSETVPVMDVAFDHAATVAMDEQTPCFAVAPGAWSPYRVFQIPDAVGEYVITVSSVRLGETLFAPHLMLLDPSGQVTREVPLATFLARGFTLTANLRSHPGERYLIVASEPGAVGRQNEQIMSTAHASTSNGITITYGSEINDHFTYAYNGSVTVAVRLLPTAIN